jgi:hypothetical protein
MDAVLEEQQDEFLDTTWVRDAVLREQPTNMALQRLQSRVLKNSEASEIISSYDRMHHRHNRS